jgi:hypothetical protein
MKTICALSLVFGMGMSATAHANSTLQSSDRETYALSRGMHDKCSMNSETFILRKFQAERPQLRIEEIFCEGAFSRRNGKPYVGCILYPESSSNLGHFVALLDPTCRRSFAAFESKRPR